MLPSSLIYLAYNQFVTDRAEESQDSDSPQTTGQTEPHKCAVATATTITTATATETASESATATATAAT